MRKVQDLSEVSTEFITGWNKDGSLHFENITVFTNAHSPESHTECFQLFLAHDQMIDGQPVMWTGRDRLLAHYFGLITKEREESARVFYRSIADKLYQREPLTGAGLLHARMHCEMKMTSSMLDAGGSRMKKDFLLRHFVVSVSSRLRPDKSVESAIEELPPELKQRLKMEYKVDDAESLRQKWYRADKKFNSGQAAAEHRTAKDNFLKKRMTINRGDASG